MRVDAIVGCGGSAQISLSAQGIQYKEDYCLVNYSCGPTLMFHFSNPCENFREIKTDFLKIVQEGSVNKGETSKLVKGSWGDFLIPRLSRHALLTLCQHIH